MAYVDVIIGTSSEDRPPVLVDEFESVKVDFGEDSSSPRAMCERCGAQMNDNNGEDKYGRLLDDEMNAECEDDTAEVCPDCEAGTVYSEDDDTDTCDRCSGTGNRRQHKRVEEPLTWLNSARITVDEARNRVSVSISAGDPNGAFVMEMWKLPDGSIMLGVPEGTMTSPHMPMFHMGGGTYQVAGAKVDGGAR